MLNVEILNKQASALMKKSFKFLTLVIGLITCCNSTCTKIKVKEKIEPLSSKLNFVRELPIEY